jgi:hypothetical protein
MAQESLNITVAGEGHIYVADFGETLPTGMVAPGGNWDELGWMTKDGATFSVTPNVNPIPAWGSPDPVRQIIQSKIKAVSFVAEEYNAVTLGLAWGGGAAQFTDFGTYVEYEEPDLGVSDQRALIIDFVDEDEDFRFIFPKGSVTGEVSTQLTDSGAALLPVTFSPVRTSSTVKGFYFRTNSPELLAAIGS